MAKRDPAWDLFKEHLKLQMGGHGGLPKITSRELARDLLQFGGVHGEDMWEQDAEPAPRTDEEVVSDWRQGRSRPPLALLAGISRVIYRDPQTPGASGDPLQLFRKMGMLPDDPQTGELVALAYRLQKLELKLQAARERSAAIGRSGGAAAIAQAAAASGKWAVAVWPAVEGPPGCQMHVSDRIDIQRTDDVDADPWLDPELKSKLRAAYAVPGVRGPRWAPGVSQDDGSQDDDRIHRWSIPYIGNPSAPVASGPYPDLASIAFTSLTVNSWVNDVAALSALVIGYGLTTTRDLAMETSGQSRANTSEAERRQIHHALLAEPPVRRAWSHHASLQDANPDDGKPPAAAFSPACPFTSTAGSNRRPILHVWLREDDALLKAFATETAQTADPNLTSRLIQQRRWLDDRATMLVATRRLQSHQLLIIDVQHCRTIAATWEQVLVGVHQVLEHLVQHQLRTRDLRHVHELLHRDSPTVGGKLLTWLHNKGNRAVTRPLSTDSSVIRKEAQPGD